MRFIYFADRAALSIAMMVFDGDEFFEPKFLCRRSEHQSWKSFGGWPWEPRLLRRRRRRVPPTQA